MKKLKDMLKAALIACLLSALLLFGLHLYGSAGMVSAVSEDRQWSAYIVKEHVYNTGIGYIMYNGDNAEGISDIYVSYSYSDNQESDYLPEYFETDNKPELDERLGCLNFSRYCIGFADYIPLDKAKDCVVHIRYTDSGEKHEVILILA